MNIEIKNIRHANIVHPYDVMVDRNSPLGNPYRMYGEYERDAACAYYEPWLLNRLKDSESEQNKELNRLVNLYWEHNKLNLFCWCVPRRCHAETIKQELIRRIYDE